MSTVLHNKGKTGQLLEWLLDKPLDSDILDFSDGELKSYKSDSIGNPLETIAVTQLSSIYDDMIGLKKFKDSKVFKKIHNVLYVGISKNGSPNEWYISRVEHVNLSDKWNIGLFELLSDDYKEIRRQLIALQSGENKMIHTISGTYLQIRAKDSKDKAGKYHPIFSSTYDNYVSTKNYAFYLKKDFIKNFIS